ncbi:MAG: hydroxymethylpyrimidine/phosphomethylpyrimidine kinase [Burkholderiales bacterium]
MPTLPRFVLSFAASDPTGGAGMQADLLTFASMGCHPLSVLTAITVQDTHGVEAIQPVAADWVSDQARALLDEFRVAAFKLGVLGSAANAAAISRVVAAHPGVPMVLDPVLASARGDALASGEILDSLRELLLPLATVVTPNSLEARALAARGDDSGAPALEECARRLLELGCRHVLITGTHEDTPEVTNTLFSAGDAPRSAHWTRLPGSYHGSGCTLAAAIAARLAHGAGVDQAVREAQEFTWQALATGYRPGSGQHLPDRFFWARGIAAAAP